MLKSERRGVNLGGGGTMSSPVPRRFSYRRFARSRRQRCTRYGPEGQEPLITQLDQIAKQDLKVRHALTGLTPNALSLSPPPPDPYTLSPARLVERPRAHRRTVRAMTAIPAQTEDGQGHIVLLANGPWSE